MQQIIFSSIILSLLFIACTKQDSNPADSLIKTKLIGVVIDVNGNPLANVKITTEPETNVLITNQFGIFELNNINAGIYKIIAEKEGYLKAITNAAVKYNDTTNVQIILRILMSISGKVIDEITKEGIEGASIQIENYSSKITTGNNGTFHLENIPAGANIFSVTKEKYAVKKESIFIYPDKTSNYEISLSKLTELQMIFVRGGTFRMGDTFGDGNYSEKPAHDVNLSSFYISKYEITQRNWIETMGNNPAKFWNDDNPVESITWNDAIEFCNQRSILEGLQQCYRYEAGKIVCDFNANGYRLPTEAEWEFAARGGLQSKNTKFSGSSNISEVAWYYNNSDNAPHSVGLKSPNELGIHDMSGNVWEYCWDYYDENYYSQSPAQNPTGPLSGNSHVIRGGSWTDDAVFNKVYYRNYYENRARGSNVGFRIVRIAK